MLNFGMKFYGTDYNYKILFNIMNIFHLGKRKILKITIEDNLIMQVRKEVSGALKNSTNFTSGTTTNSS